MIYRAINELIRHAIEADLITNDDIFVVRNQLMDILKLTGMIKFLTLHNYIPVFIKLIFIFLSWVCRAVNACHTINLPDKQ